MVASITEAKNQLSALIDRVRGGESMLIVDRGVPVARLKSAAACGNPLVGRPPRPRGDASIAQTLIRERREGR